MSYKSRFPEIEVELVNKMDVITKMVADAIVEGAKERVPVASGRLKAAIHAEQEGDNSYSVIAGDSAAFYGHIVEHGGASHGAHPFLVPALEQVRPEIEKLAREILGSL